MYDGNLDELRRVVDWLQKLQDGEFSEIFPDSPDTHVRPIDIAQHLLFGELSRRGNSPVVDNLAARVARCLKNLGWRRVDGTWIRPSEPLEELSEVSE